MDAGRLGAANRIFDAVLELDPSRREAEIAARCDGDGELDALVRRLLGHTVKCEAGAANEAEPGSLWREAMGELAHAPSLAHGDRIACWKLLRRIGHGGSAEVYLAERDQGGVRQQVAIKLMRPEGVDAIGIARFRQEQQILARLSHPAIGRIYDVGLSEAGRPFFVMEFVDGEPIDQYCDRNGLDLRARLRLFLRVADAVAHAHGELVTHRDIKPGNVLVDAHGQPRLLDFGIAKMLDAQHADGELTQPGGAPATPGYASPEQLAGRAVGTASDIYQLGLLAYVLLAGQRPQPRLGLSREEAARLARGAPRLAPSAKLRALLAAGERERVVAIAEQRRLKVGALLRGLSGDLDEVVLKAIAPDPAERYATVAQLADDVRAVLDGRPVTARAPSPWYLLRRAMRRHRVLTALFSTALLGLVAFSIAVTWLALSLDQARARAEQHSLLSDQVMDYLVGSFRAAEPERGGDRDSLVRRALDNAAQVPDTRYGRDPAFLARLHLVLGRAYESLHEYLPAQHEYERTLAIAQAMPDEERRYASFQAYNGLGRVAMREGEPERALLHFEHVIRLTEGDRSARELHLAALANTANAFRALGRRDAALEANARAMRGFLDLHGPDHVQSLRIQLARAQHLSEFGRYAPRADLDEAAQLLAPLVARAPRILGGESIDAQIVRLLHARLLSWRGEHGAAIAALYAALPEAARVLGERDLFVLNARRALGQSLAARGDASAGLAELDAVIEGFLARFGDRHPDLGRSRFDRAVLLFDAGHGEEAVAALDQADLEFLAQEPGLLRAYRAAAPGADAIRAGAPPSTSASP